MSRVARLVALTWLLAHSCVSLAGNDIGEKLYDAVTCRHDPINTIYRLIDQGSDFASGYAAYGFGEGIDYRGMIVLRTPLMVGRTGTHAVIVESENSHADFQGVVYGRFTGDYREVVAKFNLRPAETNGGIQLGTYERWLGVDIDGKKNVTCPMAIILTPLKNRQFLFGCGWCNG